MRGVCQNLLLQGVNRTKKIKKQKFRRLRGFLRGFLEKTPIKEKDIKNKNKITSTKILKEPS